MFFEDHIMNGVVVIDKAPGKTSFEIVRDIKRMLKVRKIGHAGTLDPLATGVLPVCINEATKLMQFFSNDNKIYRASMLLGVETDTLDIEDVTKNFLGKIEQKPPSYSAVKFKGKPLYKWTREGVSVDPVPRMVEIYRIEVEKIALPYVTFQVACSKGTYIRSLCADMGRKLGCGACMAGLRRIKSGYFNEESALKLGDLTDRKKVEVIRENIIPIADALPDFYSVSVDNEIAEKIRKGYQPDSDMLNGHDISSLAPGDMLKFVTEDNKMVAVARLLLSYAERPPSYENRQMMKILRVFNS
jgi:tRNA pseudouridine55 synthase